jgi:hypothetical protein
LKRQEGTDEKNVDNEERQILLEDSASIGSGGKERYAYF